VSAEHLRILLDIDPAAEPIGGSLTPDGAAARPFSGWLALGRALEEELVLARGLHGEPALPAHPPPDDLATRTPTVPR
jgi:hypothetical protein